MYTVPSSAKESRAFWAEPNTSPGTIRKRARLCKLSQHRSDNVARLYLGLTLYRLGDQKAALTNIQRDMNEINNWLDYLNTNFALEFGQGWDPGGTIRAGIKTDLAMMSSGKVDWPKLIADGERLGIKVVQEEQNFRVQSLRG
jgi:hypothetical protein